MDISIYEKENMSAKQNIPKLDLESKVVPFGTPPSPRSYFMKSTSYGQFNQINNSPLRKSEILHASPIRAATMDDSRCNSPNSISGSNSNSNSPHGSPNMMRRFSTQEYSTPSKLPTIPEEQILSPRKTKIKVKRRSDKRSNSLIIPSTVPLSPRTKVNTQSLSPRQLAPLHSPILSPRSPRSLPQSPRSPRSPGTLPKTPRHASRSSYIEMIQYIKNRSKGMNSPRPSELIGFCKNNSPICLFYQGKNRKEIGRELLKHPKLWRTILKIIGQNSKNNMQPEKLYDLLNGLEICYKLPNQENHTRTLYTFKKLPLNEITQHGTEKHHVIIIKDGEIQEVIDSNDPDLLVQNFKRNYHRYVPIFKWFQSHGYQDFQKPGKNLYQIIQEMGAHKLYGYLEKTEHSSKEYICIQVCPVY